MNQFIFQSGTAGAQNIVFAAGTNVYVSPHALKGLLHSFEFKTNTTGSLFLIQSGTNSVLHTNVAPSGAAWQRTRPVDLTAAALGSPYTALPIPIMEPLIVAVSGAGASSSGTFLVRYC